MNTAVDVLPVKSFLNCPTYSDLCFQRVPLERDFTTVTGPSVSIDYLCLICFVRDVSEMYIFKEVTNIFSGHGIYAVISGHSTGLQPILNTQQ